MINIDLIRPNTVSVLIGPNGSGKSRLLRKLCVDFLHRGDAVVSVAPTIYDRFRRMPGSKFRFFGARLGRRATCNVVRSALERASLENPQILKNLTRALQYTNFEPVIGIRLSKLKLDNFPAAAQQLSKRDAEELHSALLKWRNQGERLGIVRLRMDSFSFEELDALSFAILARHDELLRRTDIAAHLEYFLYRDDEPVPLLEACSGELCFITTIAFIATQIKPRSVIAIDEPETSLHPNWQQNYVQTLLDIFYHYEPRILISTHSPIIISGAEAERANTGKNQVLVYELKKDEPATLFPHEQLSLEEMYDHLFDLITPKNHHLSRLSVTALNDLNSGTRGLEEVLVELRTLQEKSYDESQKAVIGKIEEMAEEVAAIKGEA